MSDQRDRGLRADTRALLLLIGVLVDIYVIAFLVTVEKINWLSGTILYLMMSFAAGCFYVSFFAGYPSDDQG